MSGLDRDSVVQLLVCHGFVHTSGLFLTEWISPRPFHAAIGILTTRMLLNLAKAILFDKSLQSQTLEVLAFQPAAPGSLVSPVRNLAIFIHFTYFNSGCYHQNSSYPPQDSLFSDSFTYDGSHGLPGPSNYRAV
jgi:hypothetical protein